MTVAEGSDVGSEEGLSQTASPVPAEPSQTKQSDQEGSDLHLSSV